MTNGLQRFWGGSAFDLLVPVPLHAGRLRERGFNQSLLLAAEISTTTGIPCEKRLLLKVKSTVPQIHLSGSQREKEIKGAFRVSCEDRIQRKTVLLIDDVFTTGATVNECSKVLLASGAQRVDVLTLAHAVKRI
jgi:ComF family protein